MPLLPPRNETPRRGGSVDCREIPRKTLPLARRTFPKVQIFTVEDYFVRRNLPALCGPRHTSDTIAPKAAHGKKAKPIQKDSGQRKLEL
jgi:hypothetical protein